MTPTARPVNRYLLAALYALAVTAALYLGDQFVYLPALRERGIGLGTVFGFLLMLLLALAGAGLSTLFDRLSRPRGIFVLALVLLAANFILNLLAMPGFFSFFQHPKEMLFWTLAAGLMGYSYVSISRAGQWVSLVLIAGLLLFVLVWSVYPFDLIFSRHPVRYALMALFMAADFGAATRVRRRLLRPLRLDLAFALLVVVVAVAGHVGVHAFLASRGVPPRPAGDGQWSKTDRPNIVLVVWDTVRKDHLSLYGYGRKTTPLLDEWSRQARVYTNARTVAPWTLPSHASMFTGMYSRTHGANFIFTGDDCKDADFQPLDRKLTTLAEILADAGYRTAGISANGAFAGQTAQMDQGFGYFYDEPNSRSLDWPMFHLQRRLLSALLPWVPLRLHSPWLSPAMPAEEVVDRTLTYIDSVDDRSKPLFLFLNFMDAHGPTYPSPDLRYVFPGYQKELSSVSIKDILFDMFASQRRLTDREREHLVSKYDAQLLRLDRETDRLRRELARRGILDNTVFVLVSDHGEFLGEHGLLEHGMEVYEEVVAIPLLIERPQAAQAGLDPTPIENRDLFFMLLREAGIERPEPPRDWDQASEFYPGCKRLEDGKIIEQYTRLKRAVVFGPLKYITSSGNPPELYDLAGDPRELKNLYRTDDRGVAEGRRLTELFLQSIPESTTILSGSQLTPEQAHQLRALGYIQ